MKHIFEYLIGGKRIGVREKNTKKYLPTDREELLNLVIARIDKEGNNADLNDIDTSRITDMSRLFSNKKTKFFNGNINEWDVSKVEDMTSMFEDSYFNGDISKWDVSNVVITKRMFFGSKFNQDIRNWNLESVMVDQYMFGYCNIKSEYIPKTN